MKKRNKDTAVIVDIIGAGAIGLMFATRLKRVGIYIRVWCQTSKQATRIKNNGIQYRSFVNNEEEMTVNFDEVYSFNEGYTQANAVAPSLFTLVAVKQTAMTESFLGQLSYFSEHAGQSPIIAIQNGIGHIEKLREKVQTVPVVQAVTSEAARREDDVVLHTGIGRTDLSFVSNMQNTMNLIAECLNNAGIQTFVSKGIQDAVYNKLIVNAVINPLTALFRVQNGLLPQQAARLNLMQLLFDESKAIIEQAFSIQLSITFGHLLQVCEKTALNQSSMLADIVHHRETEIEAINGALVKLAEAKQLPTSINKTVYLLILAQHP